MRLGLASTLALFAILVPSAAMAGAVTVGVHAGSLQTATDADNHNDAQSELGAFGRIAVAERLSLQLDIAQVSMRDEGDLSLTSITGSAVLDLVQGTQLVPIFLVGLGLDSASGDYYDASGTRSEIGVGLEYRAKTGFVVGIDVRAGHRKVDEGSTVEPQYDGMIGDDTRPIALDPSDESNLPRYLSAGQYRSARLYAGLRF
jgi:hypothetical protein